LALIAGGDIGEGKVAGFLGDARMEHDLEQQIAKLVFQRGHVFRVRSRRQLRRLPRSYRARSWRRSARSPIRSRLRVAQAGHDRQQAFERGNGAGSVMLE
jgi:hypothetical protein